MFVWCSQSNKKCNSLFTVVMAFGGARTRCFSNLFAQNVVICGVDISPARHSENPKNNL